MEISKFKLVLEVDEKFKLTETKIANPEIVYYLMRFVCKINKEPEEVLYLLTFDSAQKVSGIFEVSRGTLNSTVATPREIFKRAIVANADSIILVHNHPSGSLVPSQADMSLTTTLATAGEMLGIPLVDHLIIGLKDNFLSLKKEYPALF